MCARDGGASRAALLGLRYDRPVAPSPTPTPGRSLPGGRRRLRHRQRRHRNRPHRAAVRRGRLHRGGTDLRTAAAPRRSTPPGAGSHRRRPRRLGRAVVQGARARSPPSARAPAAACSIHDRTGTPTRSAGAATPLLFYATDSWFIRTTSQGPPDREQPAHRLAPGARRRGPLRRLAREPGRLGAVAQPLLGNAAADLECDGCGHQHAIGSYAELVRRLRAAAPDVYGAQFDLASPLHRRLALAGARACARQPCAASSR